MTKLCDSAIGRILDQSLLFGNLEFTVSILANATDLTFSTVKSCLKRLESIKWVDPTRKLGNAQAYRFNVNHMSGFIKWATEFQMASFNDDST